MTLWWRYCCAACPLDCTLQWHHNGLAGVSNHQPHHCLFSRVLRSRSKKTSKLRATGLCAGIHRWLVNSSHKWPITRKMFPLDDVIMALQIHCTLDEHCRPRFKRGSHRSSGDYSHKGPVMWSFDDFIRVNLNKLLNKQSSCWWLGRHMCMTPLHDVMLV